MKRVAFFLFDVTKTLRTFLVLPDRHFIPSFEDHRLIVSSLGCDHYPDHGAIRKSNATDLMDRKPPAGPGILSLEFIPTQLRKERA